MFFVIFVAILVFMKIVFMGTPPLAVPHLEAIAREHEIVGVVTQPDKMARRGRKMEAASSAVKMRALEMNFPVLQPERARDESFVAQIRALRPEAIAVVAYGQILPQTLLDIPAENFPNGACLNVHFSLLPRWRGAAPVQRAIQHGDTHSGVTVQWMVAKLDAGDVLLQESVAIENGETSPQLLERLTPIGARLLNQALQMLGDGNAPRVPQNESAVTMAPSIDKDEARVDWNLGARQIENLARAFVPWPVAWCHWRGESLKIWQCRASDEKVSSAAGTIAVRDGAVLVACGSGALQLLRVQAAGKAKLDALDWARGARLEAGAALE
ncbi:MAG: methionyl-tRNA formyltransferase [Acidimicrobiales bacterium]